MDSQLLLGLLFGFFGFLIYDVWCTDYNNNHQKLSSSVWTGTNSSATQFDLGQKRTTPWPALGERPKPQTHHVRNSAISTNNKQPAWVLPNGSVNWVRNTPGPTNQNIDFINREKDGNGGIRTGTTPVPNAKPMIVKPFLNQATTKKPPNLSYANVLGNTGSLGVSNNKPSSNIGLPTPVSTVSPLFEKGTKTVIDLDSELKEFSEEIYTRETNSPNRYVTVNPQEKSRSSDRRDNAPEPLLTVNPEVYNLPSVAKLILLHNNYIVEANQNEVVTAQERLEENDFLDTILATPAMQHTRSFLIKKGKVGKDPKDFKDLLRLIWFQMYSRGGGRIGSSGFEHVFLTELKNNKVSGLHNWLYFSDEEKKANLNYLGYSKKIDFGNKGSIMKLHFTFRNVDKPVGSMFIGTSPELEMALYTTCFLLKPDMSCPLQMNGKRFVIQTYTYRYRSKDMIGSAFPDI